MTELSGWLYLPLTPARQAAIRAFEARRGEKITDALLKALDGITSNTGRLEHEEGPHPTGRSRAPQGDQGPHEEWQA